MSEEKKTFDFAPRTLGAGFIHKKDLVLAIILVAFGAFMYYEAGKFPEAPAILGDTLNAEVFPKMLITLLTKNIMISIKRKQKIVKNYLY